MTARIFNPMTNRFIKNTKVNRKRIAKTRLKVITKIVDSLVSRKQLINDLPNFVNELVDTPDDDLIIGDYFNNLMKTKREKMVEKIDKINKRKLKRQQRDVAILKKQQELKINLESEGVVERLNRTTKFYNFKLNQKFKKKKIRVALNFRSIPKLEGVIEKLKRKYSKPNTLLRIKATFESENGFAKNLLVQDNAGSKLTNLLQTLTVTDYILYLVNLSVFQVKFKTEGGCDSKQHTKTIKRVDEKYTLTSMKSKNNNCLLAIFIKFAKDKKLITKKVMPKTLKKLLFPTKEKDDMIDITEIWKVAEYFKVGFRCYNQLLDIVEVYKPELSLVVDIMLVIDHYYFVEFKEQIEKYCKDCNKKYFKKHTCNTNRISFINHKFGKKDCVTTKIKKYDEIDSLKNVLVYDFETLNCLQGDAKKATPYSVGYKFVGAEGGVKQIWGKDCLVKFVDYLLGLEEPTVITAYNGANFDLYFILNELNRRGVEIKDIIKNGNSILKLDFGNCKVFDLCKFLLTSLDKACKGFKIENAKTSFDHNLIKCWDDAIIKHRSEIEYYLDFDILALEELLVKVSDEFYNKYSVHLLDYFTVSHLSYTLWKDTFNNLNNNIYLTKDEDDYEFVRKSIIGGRTYPLQKYYRSGVYDEFEKNQDDKTKIKELYNKAMGDGDFIFNADVNSLYPSAMINFEYPVGKHRYSKNPELDFKNGLLGIYKVNFESKKDVIVSPFSSKTKEGRLSWNVEDGQGVYNSIDIQNAIDIGYKVEFLNKAIVWDKKENIFEEYINDIYAMKKEAKETGNKVRYALSKLLMNSLYGKTLQRACVDSTKIVKSFEQLSSFLENYNIEDFDELSGDSIILTGVAINIKTKITKPSHIGSFVLGYSRKIMLDYMREVSPDLTEHPFTYTDTDSLHIYGKDYFKLVSKGLVNEEVGGMSNDIDGNNPIIIREINFAPKLYCYWWIDADGNHGFTNKAKGLPKKLLKKELYTNEKKTKLSYFGFKKIGSKVYKPDRKNGFDHFTIKPVMNTRTFLNSTWQGMDLINNKYYPKGYEIKCK